MITPGLYKNVPFEEYKKWDCFHKSMVAPLLRSGKHLQAYIDEERKSSKAMDFGSLVDVFITEPQAFNDRFGVLPETYINSKGLETPWTLQSKTCREIVESMRKKGKIPVSESDVLKAKRMVDEIDAHETAQHWKKGEGQVSIVWQDKETGIMCKSRMDIYHPDERIVDLKVTYNASPREFSRTACNMLYHVQASMYAEGLSIVTGGNILPFSFIVVEDAEPHCVATYEMSPDAMITGSNLFRRAIRKYKDYKEIGPIGYSRFAEELDIPQYAKIIEMEDL